MKKKRKHRKSAVPPVPQEVCRNCGTPLHGPYCHNCGQYAVDLNQSFGSFIMEYISNAFQFDKRILPTLKLLFCRPGALTQEYFKGRINSYVHPLKMNMFLLVIVIALFLFSAGSMNFEGAEADSALSDSLKSTFQTYFPLLLLLMTPLLGLFIQLCNLRTHRPYMEHFVFALHYSAFVEILFLIYMCISAFWDPDWLVHLFAIAAQIYLMIAIRNNHPGTGWIKSFFKALAINILYLLVIIAVLVLIMLIFIYRNSEVLQEGL
ncbi:MAG: DUF3667 domain-containing protein [Candidatus Cryptobacteroides sp.]